MLVVGLIVLVEQRVVPATAAVTTPKIPYELESKILKGDNIGDYYRGYYGGC